MDALANALIGALTNASFLDGMGICFLISLIFPQVRRGISNRIFNAGHGVYATKRELTEHAEEEKEREKVILGRIGDLETEVKSLRQTIESFIAGFNAGLARRKDDPHPNNRRSTD